MSDVESSGPSLEPSPVERVRGSRPKDASWRAEALGGSRHSRWADELRQPMDLQDRKRAEAICGQVTRLALQDFAPALLLLPRQDRRRVQAATAYSLTLFDFARQGGLEGERLAGINRWEFDLEATLDGQPVGQPVYLLIHTLEQERPWNRDAFDLLHSAARRRCVGIRPADRSAAEREALIMGKSLVWLLLVDKPTEPIVRFAAALVRLNGLLHLGDDLRRHCSRLPISEIPDSWVSDGPTVPEAMTLALDEEGERLKTIFGDREFESHLPIDLHSAARYCRRAASKLLRDIQQAGVGIIESPPQISLMGRLELLLRSRWL